MTIELVSVFVLNEGREVQLEVELRQGENSDRRSFKMPRSIFESLGISEGEITREDMTEIMDADERYKALKRAFDIIAYGRNSRKVLEDKLRHRGFSPQIARDIAEYMKNHGYIDEDEDATREVDVCVRKLWGSRRILMHLHQKGYDSETINAAKKYMDTIDFVDVCVKLVREKYKTLPKDDAERQKVIAAIIRHGFSMSEIKAAAKIIEYYRLPGDF
ncbi:MAG: RecX family transcriptional regulator [Clostridia bacterium]|nr:RecX family transcriptional regulator [Clostridia bacterium]